MNVKQQQFADAYLVNKNATAAAMIAGYSPKTSYAQGCRLLKDAEVSRYIKKKLQSVAEKLGIDSEYVLRGLKTSADLTIPKRHESNPSIAVKSLELLGKHLRLFEENDKKETNISINIVQF